MDLFKSIILLLLIYVTFSQKALILECIQVNTTVCSSGYQFYARGSSEGKLFEKYVCVSNQKICNPNTVSQFTMQACRVDYKNEQCPTTLCFMLPQKQICTKDRTCQNSPYFENYNCVDCTKDGQNADCEGKCFEKKIGENNIQSLTCLGKKCTQGLAKSQTTVQFCDNGFDALGQECSCCVKTQQVSRFCTSNSQVLSNYQIYDFFKGELSLTTLQQNYGSIIKEVSLYALFLIALTFMN